MGVFFCSLLLLPQVNNHPTINNHLWKKASVVNSLVLQKVLYDKGTRCSMVTISYRYGSISKGDFFQFKCEEIRLCVCDYSLGNNKSITTFELPCSSFTTGLQSGWFPFSECGWIASEPLCLLPTARLVDNESGSYLVVFDGIKGQLYFRGRKIAEEASRIGDAPDYKFKRVERITIHEQKLLSDLFLSSFDPCDVYWDYFLVTHSFFFGYECDQKFESKSITTDLLYKRWKLANKH